MAESTIKRDDVVVHDLLSGGYTADIIKNSDNNFVMRCGRVCVVQFDIRKGTGSNPFASNVLIPDDCLPYNNISCLVGDGSVAGQTVFKLTDAGRISGVYFGSTGYLQGSVCYICK